MVFIIGLLLGLVIGCVVTFISLSVVLAKFDKQVNGELNNLIKNFQNSIDK